MQIIDLRKWTNTPTLPTSSAIMGVFANSNGVLNYLSAGSGVTGVSHIFTGSYTSGQVQTGNAINVLQTGLVFGSGHMLLGAPPVFIPITVGTTNYLVPAYAFKNT